MLSESELRSMRKTTAEFLGSKATVYRAHNQQDNTGRTVKVYLPVSGLSAVACDVEKPRSQSAATIAERQVPSHEREIVFPHGSAVLKGDLVKVGANIWEVIGSDADRTDTLCLRCEVISDTEGRIPR